MDCSRPKLCQTESETAPLMEKRGFTVKNIDGVGEAYYFSQNV
jgi:hypothetical protein